MENLRPSVFLIPVIALTLVIISYVLLLQKAVDKRAFKRYTLVVLLVGFLLNLIWEIAQVPLFQEASFTANHIMYCALASIADAIMVLLIYNGFALIYKNHFWPADFTLLRVALIMLVGGIGAILAELRHLSLGNWSYAETMPLVPFVKVGWSPVLQFMLLPPLIYYLAYQFIKKRELNKRKSNHLVSH